MDRFYAFMTNYDGEAIYGRRTDDWIAADAGYFSSFAEAKAEAKNVIKKRFDISDDHLISEIEDGWESDYGNESGYFVRCIVRVFELDPPNRS